MKKILYIIIILLSSIKLYPEEFPLIGSWILKQRVVVDYNGNLNYENYTSYILLKSDIYKNNCTPEIDTYEEIIQIIFNKNKSGSYIVDMIINGKQSTLDWSNKSWDLSTKPHISEDFSWKVKDNILELDLPGKESIYKFNITKLDENNMQLELTQEEDDFREAGIYTRKVNKKDGLRNE